MLTPFSIDEVRLMERKTLYQVSTKCGNDKTFYRFGFNGQEKDNELKGKGNVMAYEARMYDDRVGRWFSPDELEKKYPSNSTYSAFNNSPILYVDADGKENIVYLVVTPKNRAMMKTAKAMAVYANTMLAASGVNKKVVVMDGTTFNVKGLDPSDHVAVYGANKTDVSNFTKKNLSTIDADISKYDAVSNWADNDETGKINPERSNNPNTEGRHLGKVIGLSNMDIQLTGLSDEKKATTAEKGAYFVVHGLLHNLGVDHNGGLGQEKVDGDKCYNNGSLMDEKFSENRESLDRALNGERKAISSEALEDVIRRGRLNNECPKDNYKTNCNKKD